MLTWLPQRGVKSVHYLPTRNERAVGKVDIMVFDFPATGSLATDESAQAAGKALLIDKLTASMTDPANGAPLSGTFQVQFYHQHGSVQRQLFFSPQRMELVAGSGKRPFIFKSPYLLEAGDTLTCAISNVAQKAGAYVAADIQVVVFGVQAE